MAHPLPLPLLASPSRPALLRATLLRAARGGSAGVVAARLADLARWALEEEAALTPKPALVDGRGNGAHPDLSLDALRRSAAALRPGFHAMALAAHGQPASQALRETLGRIGRTAEAAMMVATGGSNAHRGAIWALGLLVAGAAQGPADGGAEIAARAAALARLPDRFAPASLSRGASLSHGQDVAARFGVGGAREEARQGFPHVVAIALPALRRARANGAGETHARLDALMAVMSRLDDTCLLHRGGRAALDAAKTGAAAVLEAGGSTTTPGQEALARLHDTLMRLNASPGGAADMLAAALFLDALAHSPSHSPRSERPLRKEAPPWKC